MIPGKGHHRAAELLQQLEQIHIGAIEVIQVGDATGATRKKLLADIRTAHYVMKKALENVARFARTDV